MQTGLIGAKPEAFGYWLFEVLNAQPGDTLDDLFPTKATKEATVMIWRRWNGLSQTIRLTLIELAVIAAVTAIWLHLQP